MSWIRRNPLATAAIAFGVVTIGLPLLIVGAILVTVELDPNAELP